MINTGAGISSNPWNRSRIRLEEGTPRRPGSHKLLLLAMHTARKHKWEESQRVGRDLGEPYCFEWFRANWRRWYRQRWVEHITGQARHDEFSESLHNFASRLSFDPALVSEIVRMLGGMGENLSIILWAEKTGKNMEDVKRILWELDINGHRPSLDEREIHLSYLALEEADRFKWIESQKNRRDMGQQALMDWIEQYGPDFLLRNMQS